MFRLVIASVLVSATFACNLLQAPLVKDQWAEVSGDGLERESFISDVFNHIFDAAPEARAIFERVRGDNVYSHEFKAHALRVMSGLDLCIGALDQIPRLDASLAHLKSQHDDRAIPAEYWAAFKAAVFDIVPDRIGLCFQQDAWDTCMDRIINNIN